ncbi:glutaredoxin family protein [Psychrobacter sp. 16-MNA-CIBAN-0192]|uniref:glutaredoxin family protein n=1 Tax=Psychrobacter sp. 16-MNA-CIBAN-0192 TaxID=3140448 RepID=UPI003329C0F3
MSPNISSDLNADKNNRQNIKSLRATIINALANCDTDSVGNHYQHDWLLLGTSGCRLCDQAEEILRQLQAVYPISYQLVDIADFDEPLMMTFATTIPVLITHNQRLNYPFSILDLQQLV